MGIIYPGLAFVEVEFLPTFCLRTIILAPDMLESQSRAQKTEIIA